MWKLLVINGRLCVWRVSIGKTFSYTLFTVYLHYIRLPTRPSHNALHTSHKAVGFVGFSGEVLTTIFVVLIPFRFRYELRMNVNQQTPMASPYGQPQPGYGQPGYGAGYQAPYAPYNNPASVYQPGAPPQGNAGFLLLKCMWVNMKPPRRTLSQSNI